MYLTLIKNVIPAKAGIQSRRRHRLPWIPAFAGMTGINVYLTPINAMTPINAN